MKKKKKFKKGGATSTLNTKPYLIDIKLEQGNPLQDIIEEILQEQDTNIEEDGLNDITEELDNELNNFRMGSMVIIKIRQNDGSYHEFRPIGNIVGIRNNGAFKIYTVFTHPSFIFGEEEFEVTADEMELFNDGQTGGKIPKKNISFNLFKRKNNRKKKRNTRKKKGRGFGNKIPNTRKKKKTKNKISDTRKQSRFDKLLREKLPPRYRKFTISSLNKTRKKSNY